MIDPTDPATFVNVVPPTTPPYETDLNRAEMSFAWEQRHRRPFDGPTAAVCGFTVAGGLVTLQLPNPKTEVRVVFRDGRPQRELVPSAMAMPAMARLRMEALAGLRSPAGVLQFDLSLLAYAAALIRTTYAVTDAELGELLGGRRWHDDVVRHLLGGDAEVDRLRRLNVTAALGLLDLAASPPPTATAVTEPTITPPHAGRRRWSFPWQRPQQMT